MRSLSRTKDYNGTKKVVEIMKLRKLEVLWWRKDMQRTKWIKPVILKSGYLKKNTFTCHLVCQKVILLIRQDDEIFRCINVRLQDLRRKRFITSIDEELSMNSSRKWFVASDNQSPSVFVKLDFLRNCNLRSTRMRTICPLAQSIEGLKT